MNSNYKPQNTKINLEKMYKTCYLVDCPMHQKLDSEENWKNKKI